MKIDIFAEMQQPKEIWDGEGNEHRLIEETLAHAQLADEAGYGCFWLVEHHGAKEFSYSSAPEIMLAAIAQPTKRIRLGHGAVLGLPRINHPIRIAERAAMLDHLCKGRLELGLTRSGIPEWRLFQIEPAQARGELQETYSTPPLPSLSRAHAQARPLRGARARARCGGSNATRPSGFARRLRGSRGCA